MGVVFETARTQDSLAGVVTSEAEASQLRDEALSTYRRLGAIPRAELLQTST